MGKNVDKFQTKSTAELSASVADYTIGYEVGQGHSFSDSNCECDPWNEPFPQRMNCPAQRDLEELSSTIGIGVEAYLLLGGSISISVDVEEIAKEYVDIFHDSLSYEQKL